jgi:hypothetical protein
MTFRLRQIQFTADGRRIARDRDLAGPSVTIGRATGNDIQIADLAVEPNQAVIEARGGSRIEVNAVGTLGFTLDGKSTKRATLDAATSGQLGFGSATITVSRDNDGAILLELLAQGGPAEVPDTIKDKANFSLAAAMPGKRPVAWLLFLTILALFLGLPVASHMLRVSPSTAQPTSTVASGGAVVGRGVVGDKAWNPGELSLAHHNLSNHCEACHAKPFTSVRNETCMSCHKDVHDHAAPDKLAMARGATGAGDKALQSVGHVFGRELPGACTDCHVEHQGLRPMDQPRQQFCATCHAGLDGHLTNTKLGNAADFGTLHPQFRAWVVTNAETGARAPVSLDARPHEDNGLTFSHRIHLDRTGGVAKMASTLSAVNGGAAGYGKPLQCASCHQRSADGVSFQPISMERSCEACHSLVYAKSGGTLLRLRHGDVAQMQADLARSPNAGGLTAPIVTGRARPGDFASGGLYGARFSPPGGSVAARAFAPSGICGECHRPEMHGGKLGVRPVTMVTRYMPDGWFDHAAHRQTSCAECHAAANSNSASDVLLPKLSECRSCHLGEGATKPKVPSSCAMCHSYHRTLLAPHAARRRGAIDVLQEGN